MVSCTHSDHMSYSLGEHVYNINEILCFCSQKAPVAAQNGKLLQLLLVNMERKQKQAAC